MEKILKGLGFYKNETGYEKRLNYLSGYAETFSVSKDGLGYLVFYSKDRRGSTTIEEFNLNTLEEVLSLFDSLSLN